MSILLGLVVYDQCESNRSGLTEWMLIEFPVVKYVWNKGSIVGPTWKIPFIGPFLESVYPDMNKYIAKFNSGDLSCVSVFHKCDTSKSDGQ